MFNGNVETVAKVVVCPLDAEDVSRSVTFGGIQQIFKCGSSELYYFVRNTLCHHQSKLGAMGPLVGLLEEMLLST